MDSRRVFCAALVLASSAQSRCKEGPTAPTGGPPPTYPQAGSPPTHPQASLQSRVFENITLVRGLERAAGREGMLVAFGGRATQQGTLHPDSAWHYTFADQTAGNNLKFHAWNIYPDGTVGYAGEVGDFLRPRYDVTELEPVLVVDSPEAVRLGRQYGAQPFVDRYPAATVPMLCRFIGRVPTWEIYFAERPPAGPRCSLGPIFINAQTGDLLARSLGCLDSLPD